MRKKKMNIMYTLGIVQNKPTQFDKPLYDKIQKEKHIHLKVYYSNPDADDASIDEEIARAPGWEVSDAGQEWVYQRKPGLRGIFQFIKEISKEHHDLVIFCGYNSILYLLLIVICRFSGIATGLRSDNVLLYRDQEKWRWKIKDFLYPMLFRLFDTGHPTGSLATLYLRRYGFRDDSLFLFPYNVDNDSIARRCLASRVRQSLIRKNLGIRPSDRIVLGVLKFVDREDPVTLLDGFAHVSREYPDIHLVLVGDGALGETLKNRIHSKQIRNTHLVGYIPYDELPCYYGIAEVFVHPARVGPWEVSINEALACGVPVIASDRVGAGYDLILQGKTGYLFRAGDSESLADRLQVVLRNSQFKSNVQNDIRKIMARWHYHQTIADLLASLAFVTVRLSR